MTVTALFPDEPDGCFPRARLQSWTRSRGRGPGRRTCGQCSTSTTRRSGSTSPTRWASGSPSEGGFLVPEILRSQVMAYMTPAIVRPRATVLPMSSLRLPVPVLDNPTQASSTQVLGGLTFSFTEEGSAIAATTPSFGRTVLEARKLAAYLQNVPNEFVADAAGAFGDFLARSIAMGVAWVEDDYFIGTNGTGVGCPQSLLNAPCAVTVTRTGTYFALADIASMVNALHPASKQAGFTSGITDVCWLVSSSALSYLLELYVTIGTASNTAAGASDWLSLGDGDTVGAVAAGPAAAGHRPSAGGGHAGRRDARGPPPFPDRRPADDDGRAEHCRAVVHRRRDEFPDPDPRVDGRYWIQSATTTESGADISPVVVLK